MWRALFLVVSSGIQIAAGQSGDDYHNARIVWDSATLKLIQPGGAYGRMVRLPDRDILCTFEWTGGIYVRRSSDEGQNWSDPALAASYAFGKAANPELLVLADGNILLSYNERPNDGIHAYTIRIAISQDNGQSWGGYNAAYQAGTSSAAGCWEPSQLQLPSGEIQLYFSNQAPYPTTGEQEISIVRSWDDGATWTPPQQASFRPGHRDGMPVPLALADGSAVVLSIEDNGLSGTFKPSIVSPAAGTRWGALQPGLPAAIYAGAPYLRQFPSGETVLSVQSAYGRNDSWTLDYSRMMVYIGDATAHGFTNASEPFAVPPGNSGLWNSLFVKDAGTVTAISTTTLGGAAGVWAIDGHLEYGGAPVAPAIHSVTSLAGGPSGPVAPGELVTISGPELAPRNSAVTTLGVSFDGVASPYVYVSEGRVNAVVPYGVSSAADAVVQYGNGKTYPFPLGLVAASPEIFTQTDGGSQVIAANQDSSVNSATNPVARGESLTFWATGQGRVTTVNGYAIPFLPVKATVGGVDAQVTGAAIAYEGVLQVNILLPDGAPTGGAIGLALTIGSASSHKTATVAIR